jgi:hypothetical protein
MNLQNINDATKQNYNYDAMIVLSTLDDMKWESMEYRLAYMQTTSMGKSRLCPQ